VCGDSESSERLYTTGWRIFRLPSVWILVTVVIVVVLVEVLVVVVWGKKFFSMEIYCGWVSEIGFIRFVIVLLPILVPRQVSLN
jgi:hypothetical protein